MTYSVKQLHDNITVQTRLILQCYNAIDENQNQPRTYDTLRIRKPTSFPLKKDKQKC